MKQIALVVMDTQALVERELQVATDKKSLQADLKMTLYFHMIVPQKMKDKKIGHIVLHMEVIECKVDTLDSNQMDQLDIDQMDQTIQYQ